MGDSQLRGFLKLRLIVGYLGERSQFGWWSSTFFDASGRSFLEPSFPKTFPLAQYHGVTEAARRLHDEHIGIGRVSHLFRLPEELEQDLHKLMTSELKDEQLFSEIKNKETALQNLSEIAGLKGQKSEGPLAIAKLADIRKATTLQKFAQTYLAAFESGIRSYPYLAG